MCKFLHAGACPPAQALRADFGVLSQPAYAIVNSVLRHVLHVFLGLPHDQGYSACGRAQLGGPLLKRTSLN
jgi:hypothetical protein